MKGTKLPDIVKRVFSILLVAVMMMTSFNGAVLVSAADGDSPAEEQPAEAAAGTATVSEPFVVAGVDAAAAVPAEEPETAEAAPEAAGEAGTESGAIGTEAAAAVSEPAAAEDGADAAGGTGTDGNTGGDGTGDTTAAEDPSAAGGTTWTVTFKWGITVNGEDWDTATAESSTDLKYSAPATAQTVNDNGTIQNEPQPTSPATINSSVALTFDGWYKNGTFTNDNKVIFPLTVTENLELTARWKGTVTLNTNGGTINSGDIAKYYYDEETTLPTDVTKDGYTLDGWYDNSSLTGSKIEKIEKNTTENKAFYAGWTIKEYTVTFQPVLDNGTAQQIQKNYNTQIAENEVTEPTYTDGSMTFDGWYTQQGGQGEKLVFSGNSNATTIQSAVTYYAKWTGTVALQLNTTDTGAKITEGKNITSYTYGVATALPAKADVSRDGYEFLGWNTASDGTGNTVTEIANSATGTQTLYAQWKLNADNISVTANGKKLNVADDGNTEWTNGKVTIAPASPAAKISTSETGPWQDSIVEEQEGSTKVTYYLKDKTDGTGLTSDKAEITVNIDKTNPTVKFTWEAPDSTTKIYKKGDVYQSSRGFKITIEVAEAHLPDNDTWKTLAKAELIDANTKSKIKDLTISWGDTQSGVIILNANTDLEDGKQYALKITGIADKAGNPLTDMNGTAYSDAFEYDGTKPAASISTEKGSDTVQFYSTAIGDNVYEYYSGDFKANLSITEKDLTNADNGIPDEATVKLDGTDVAADSLSDIAYTNSEWTATLPVTGEGQHTVTLIINDNIHDEVKVEKTATIDMTGPALDSDSSKTTDKAKTGSPTKAQELQVTYTDAASGVKNVYYYIEAQNENYDVNNLSVTGAEAIGTEGNPAPIGNGAALTITTQEGTAFKGTVYFYAVDNVGNQNQKDDENYISYSINIDNKAPVLTISEPHGYTGKKTDGTYYTSGDVTFDLMVTDDNITSEEQITVTVDGTTFTYRHETEEGDSESGTYWTKNGNQWTTTICIPTNAKDPNDGTYQVQLSAEDDVGLPNSTISAPLVIDTTRPVVEISGPDGATGGDADDNGTYYSHGDVTFKLTVTDVNLDAEDITVSVFKGDEEIYNTKNKTAENVTIGNWEKGTNDEWTNTIKISACIGTEVDCNGTYTVKLYAEDLAKNEAHYETSKNEDGQAVYADGAVTSAQVVIDTTDPAISISEPNNPIPTGTDSDGNYYTNGSYTVTVQVTDKNIAFADGKFTHGNIAVTVYNNITRENVTISEDAGISETGWEAEYDRETKEYILKKDITFTAPEDGTTEFEYYIQVQAWDATHTDRNSEGSAESDSDGYRAAVSKSGDGKLYILDAISPEVTFGPYNGNAVYPLTNGDYYENVTGKAQEKDTAYAIYAYNGDGKLTVDVNVADTHINFANDPGSSKCNIQVYRYNTPEAAKEAVAADIPTGSPLTENKDYTLSEKWVLNAATNVWKRTVTITGDEGYYVVYAQATDKATNEYHDTADSVLVNDLTAPAVAETRDNTTGVTGSYRGKTVYYSSRDLTATFTVTDNNHLDMGSAASVTILKYDNDGNVASRVLDTGIGWSGKDETGYEADVNLGTLQDGIYTVQIEVTDLAGNQTTYESDYYVVDKTAPTGKISSTGSGFDNSENPWTAFLNTITFGLFSKDGVTTKLSWDDKSDSFLNSGEGVRGVSYWVYTVNSGSDTTQPFADAEAVNKAASWTSISMARPSFTTPNDAKFIVYLRVEDMAGNVTIISSDGMITENKSPELNEKDTTNPEIFVTVANQYGNNSGVHAGSAQLHVEVTELPSLTFSGIDWIDYKFSDGYGGTVNLTRGQVSYGNTIDGLRGYGEEYITIGVPSGYESDRVVLTTTAADKAGNEKTVTYAPMNIDNRVPTASVSYDNNTVYNSKYFNQPRTATIQVTEMNFAAGNTTVTTTGSVSGWSGSGSGSDTVNTAAVSYTADGDYTLSFQTTDKAGHTLTDSGVTYNGAAAQDFTIDMTKPKATITFQDAEGNAVPSGGYANSTVTATISVVEHNFDESSATRGISITRDGEPYNANVNWINNGDTHVATISFIEEEGAYYTFDMSFVDLANNPCDTFQQVSFYVDTVQPAVVVSNIAQNSANNAATIAPVITITDKYYDPNQISITLRGAKNGVVSTPYTVSEIENGQQFTFANIEKDDIYTITLAATDLAGNVIDTMYVEMSDETTNELVFSVNREGSTYSVSADILELLENYYTNGLAEDLVITIINVDKLEGLTITVSRDLLDSRGLVEGEDYAIEMEEITGGYKYTVTIFKEVFDKDGAYALSVYTEDTAGNTSTNVTADEAHGLEMEFYLDTEAPSIVLNDLDKGESYAFSSYEGGSVSVSDQTLDEISVVLTYRDGTTASYVWGSDEINEEGFNGTYVARLNGEKAIKQSSGRINIRVTAKDKAGNVMEGPYEETENGVALDEDYNFYVTTNALIRFYANKGLFYGVIGGVLVLIAGVIGVILSRRKKKEEETETV